MLQLLTHQKFQPACRAACLQQGDWLPAPTHKQDAAIMLTLRDCVAQWRCWK